VLPPTYEPGQFYRRELPYVLALLESLESSPAVVVDGFVWLVFFAARERHPLPDVPTR
jgi:hypothetical protein